MAKFFTLFWHPYLFWKTCMLAHWQTSTHIWLTISISYMKSWFWSHSKTLTKYLDQIQKLLNALKIFENIKTQFQLTCAFGISLPKILNWPKVLLKMTTKMLINSPLIHISWLEVFMTIQVSKCMTSNQMLGLRVQICQFLLAMELLALWIFTMVTFQS